MLSYNTTKPEICVMCKKTGPKITMAREMSVDCILKESHTSIWINSSGVEIVSCFRYSCLPVSPLLFWCGSDANRLFCTEKQTGEQKQPLTHIDHTNGLLHQQQWLSTLVYY